LQKRKLRYKEVKQLALVYIADRGIQRMEAIPLTPLHCTEQNDGSWGKLWSGVFHLFYDKGPFDPQIIRFLICTMMGLRVYSVSGLHLLMSRDKAGKFSAGLGKMTQYSSLCRLQDPQALQVVLLLYLLSGAAGFQRPNRHSGTFESLDSGSAL
jgi:hypothetical protein